MASPHVVTISASNFEQEVVKSTTPVLVDFWAEWCHPCRQIGPIVEELATKFEGKLTVAKVNIDENPLTPNNYAVRGIPTLILFNDGKPVSTKVGAAPKSALKQWVDSAL